MRRRWWRRRLVIIMARSNQLQLSRGQYGEWPLYGLYAFIRTCCLRECNPPLAARCVKGVAFYFTHKSSLPISRSVFGRLYVQLCPCAFMNVEVYKNIYLSLSGSRHAAERFSVANKSCLFLCKLIFITGAPYSAVNISILGWWWCRARGNSAEPWIIASAPETERGLKIGYCAIGSRDVQILITQMWKQMFGDSLSIFVS